MLMSKNDRIQTESAEIIEPESAWLESKGITLTDYIEAVKSSSC
jgi:hypothetical protein